MPKFSVIIPLYNKDVHIYDTLISVLNQSYTDYEIIIVNDGSTDNSLSEVKKISSRKLILFDTENQGVSQARNFAMQEANGDYFAFLDADDTWGVNHLADLHNLILNYPNCGMYCTNYCFDYGKDYIINPKFPTLPKKDDWSGIVPDFFNASLVYRIALTSAVAIPKNTINNIGLFCSDLNYGEDTDFWVRIALKNIVAFTKTQSVIYNANAINKITDKPINDKKITTFERFLEDEKKNLSLKKFNDMYRIEYALHYKMFGDFGLFKNYKKNIDYSLVSFKNKVLLSLPKPLLISLWQCKQWLKALKRFIFITFK